MIWYHTFSILSVTFVGLLTFMFAFISFLTGGFKGMPIFLVAYSVVMAVLPWVNLLWMEEESKSGGSISFVYRNIMRICNAAAVCLPIVFFIVVERNVEFFVYLSFGVIVLNVGNLNAVLYSFVSARRNGVEAGL